MSSERFDEVRELIAANDEAIVAAVNRRLALVAELWQLKAKLGLDTLDPDRERRLRERLAAASSGPLSPPGLDRLVTELLSLTKAELGASAAPYSSSSASVAKSSGVTESRNRRNSAGSRSASEGWPIS